MRPALCAERENYPDLALGEFGSGGSLAACQALRVKPSTIRIAEATGHALGMQTRTVRISARCAMSPLGVSVGRIVRIRTEKQMLVVNTRRIVALVQHVQAVRDWSVCHLPSHAMSLLNFASAAAVPVALAVAGRRPLQARRGHPWPHVIGQLRLREETLGNHFIFQRSARSATAPPGLASRAFPSRPVPPRHRCPRCCSEARPSARPSSS